MSTGLLQLDIQHRELIRQLSELTEAMSEQRGRAQIEKIVNFLAYYVKDHFRDEEQAMEKHHCPAAVANKRAHMHFVETFTALQKRFQNEGPSSALAIAIQRDLLDWLVNHIRQVDANLHPCVQGTMPVKSNAVIGGNGHRDWELPMADNS